MDNNELNARIARLEEHARGVQRILVLVILAGAGFAFLQLSGWMPLTGSSLHIASQGRSILDVELMAGSSELILRGDEQKNSVHASAGAAGPSLSLRSADGGDVLLAAMKVGGFAAFSTSDGRRLFLTVGGPDEENIFVTQGDDKIRAAPAMPPGRN